MYNGVENQQARIRLKLSDSFIHPDESGDFEWTADMINLNEGKNDELLEHCRPLKEYMILVNEIRKNSETMEPEEAIDAAVTYCIEHNILREFLIKHRAEVKDMCITEFDEKKFVDDIREEGFEEGRLNEIYQSVQEEDYSIERGAEKAGLKVAEFKKVMEEAGYHVP